MLQKTREQLKKTSGIPRRVISNFIHRGNRFLYKRMIKLLDLQPTDKILEIGSGMGIRISLIATECDGCEIYGIDVSERQLKESVERNKQFIASHKVHLQSGDFIETSIDAKDFDKIFCINLSKIQNNLQTSLEKIKSLLKDEGTFYFYMKGKAEGEKFKFAKKDVLNQYTIEQIVEVLKSAGFKKVFYFIEKGYFIRAVK